MEGRRLIHTLVTLALVFNQSEAQDVTTAVAEVTTAAAGATTAAAEVTTAEAATTAAATTTEAVVQTLGAGCLLKDFKFLPTLTSETAALTAAGPLECQKQCVEKTECEFWTYYGADSPQSCWLAGKDAIPVVNKGANSGPKVCERSPAVCSESAPSGWPGSFNDAAAAQSAWTGGYQPVPLQCWPMKPDGTVLPCTTQEPTVLADTENGWPGECEFLNAHTTSTTKEACGKECRENPQCPSWQFTQAGKCFQGVGTHCYRRSNMPAGFAPNASQRIMHGAVQTVLSFSGFKLPDNAMTQMFSLEAFADDVQALTPEQLTTAEGACQNICKSHLRCNWWELNKVTGCRIEDPWSPAKVNVPYPIISSVMTADADVIAAGMIRHICLAPVSTSAAPPAKKEVVVEGKKDSGFPWWAILLIVVGALLILGSILFCVLSGNKSNPKRKPRAKRALKEAAVPLTAVEPVQTVSSTIPTFQQFMPQPQLLMPQQQVVRQLQPVQQTTVVAAPAAQQYVMQQQPQYVQQQQQVGYVQQGDLFRQLDRNGDGVVTQAEFQQAMMGGYR